MARELRQYGATALVGQRVNSVAELAEPVLVYQYHRCDVIRVFFMKALKFVLASRATAQLPGCTPVFSEGIKDRMAGPALPDKPDRASWLRNAGRGGAHLNLIQRCSWHMRRHPDRGPWQGSPAHESGLSVFPVGGGATGAAPSNASDVALCEARKAAIARGDVASVQATYEGDFDQKLDPIDALINSGLPMG